VHDALSRDLLLSHGGHTTDELKVVDSEVIDLWHHETRRAPQQR